MCQSAYNRPLRLTRQNIKNDPSHAAAQAHTINTGIARRLMTSLVPPAPPIPIPRSPWYAFPKKIKRSAAEILDRSTTSFARDKTRGGRRRMQNGASAETERGEEHWEKVRKRWTEGFPVRTEEQKRRVGPQFFCFCKSVGQFADL
jgi:hypothetical protein